MPPNFSSQTYWEDRFRADTVPFDWLSSDASIFTSIIHNYTRSRSLSLSTTDTKTKTETKAKTRVLHIGSGTSDLSFALRRGRDQIVGRENESESGTSDLDVTNVDYSRTAVEWGMDRERALFGDVCMRWENLDLLDDGEAWWTWGCEGQGQEEGLGGMFDVVLDKSTADAMACGEPIKVSSSGPDESEVEVHPVEVLALNLAKVVVRGGLWISLSYSAWRFDFLKEGQGVGALWNIERVENVEAKSGVEGTEKEGLVGVPVIEHRLYVLRRSDVVVGR